MVKSCTSGSRFSLRFVPETGLKREHVLQAYHKARTGYNVANAAHHTGHVATPIQGVMAQGNGLTRRAENHLMVGAFARHPNAMDRYPVMLSASGVGQVVLLGLVAGKLLVLAQTTDQGQGKSRGRINLSLVMRLYDVHVIEVGRGLLGQFLEDHGPQSEIWRNDDLGTIG